MNFIKAASDAASARSLPHVRVDRRALRHELLDGLRMTIGGGGGRRWRRGRRHGGQNGLHVRRDRRLRRLRRLRWRGSPTDDGLGGQQVRHARQARRRSLFLLGHVARHQEGSGVPDSAHSDSGSHSIRLISCAIGRYHKNKNKKPFGGVRYKRWFR